MKILVITQYFWPENFRINQLVEELNKRGNLVTVLTGKPSYPEDFNYDAYYQDPNKFNNYNKCEIVRVPIVRRKKSVISLILNYLSFVLSATIWSLFKLSTRDFDRVLVFQTSPVTSIIPGLVFSIVKSIPIAVWILDIWPDSIKIRGISDEALLFRLVKYVSSILYRKCDRLFISSKGFSEKLVRLGVEKTQIEWFPNWPEKVNYRAIRSNQHNATEFRILFAGNIGYAQDIESIAAAIKQTKVLNKNIKWTFLGNGSMQNWLHEKINEEGCVDVVDLIPAVSLSKVGDYYSDCDALLVSLKSDDIFNLTVPGKIQTYLAVGKPILGMLNGEGFDVIRASQAGLACKSGDYVSLANHANELAITDCEKLNTMGLNGKKYAEKHYEKNTVITRFCQSLNAITK